MKVLLIKIISIANKLALTFNAANLQIRGNYFYLFRITSTKRNDFVFHRSEFIKTNVRVTGIGNSIEVADALVSNSDISITGDHNQIILGEAVNLRGATVIIRGNNCSIMIGKNTTFGGVRMVNVGSGCAITIGEGCMFADHIELWASDTHSIYNDKLEIVNHEAPITIGDKVWVGCRVIVLKGISIGDGSVIGMGTTVTRDVPEHVISVGNPNRTVKEGISWSLGCEKAKNEES